MRKSTSTIAVVLVACLAVLAASCSKPQKKSRTAAVQPVAVQPAKPAVERFSYEFTGFKYKSWNVAAVKSQIAGVAAELPAKIRAVSSNSKVMVYGHADKSGPETAYKDKPGNENISLRRAQAVVDYLVKTYGLKASMFTVVGKGSQELKTPEKPFDKSNRRVEIVSE
jgi:outer membrane protein OmpA-like peptidoglycan-associated protein